MFDLKCSKHPDIQMRVERDQKTGERTAICSNCLVHHPMCNSVLYMEICQLILDHIGIHKGIHNEWVESD